MARRSGCFHGRQPGADGRVRCRVTGRTVLERYAAAAA
jgi:hypothetical protein